MKPVYQTKFGWPEGNCQSACLASILEIDIGVIPEFGVGDDWYANFQTWLVARFGLQPVDLDWETSVWKPEGYHIMSGPGPRGHRHSVVGFKGAMVHDPHPDGGGLTRVDSITVFVRVFTDE